MATLEELVIELKLDSAELKRGLSKVQADLNRTGKVADNLGATFKRVGGLLIGAFAAGKLIGDFKKAIDYMDEMADAADRVGISSESFSKLAYAAKLTEVPIGLLEMSLRKMQLALVEASDNSKSGAAAALNALGLSATNLRKVGADEALAQIADGLNSITDPARKAALAQEIFGKGSRLLNDLLKEGGDNLRKYGEEAAKLGVVIDKDMAAKAEEFKKDIERLDSQWQGFLITISDTGVIDALGFALDAISQTVRVLTGDFSELRKSIAYISNYKSITGMSEELDSLNASMKTNQDIISGKSKSGRVQLGLDTQEESVINARKKLDALIMQKAKLGDRYKQLGGDIIAGGGGGGGGGGISPQGGGATSGGSSIGSGGQGKADKDHEKSLSKALGYYEDSKTEVEKIRDTIDEINKLHVEGAFATEEQYNSALEHQEKLYDEALRQTDSLENDIRNIGNSITDGIGGELVDAMKRGKNASDALWESFKYRAINAIGDIAGKMIERGIGNLFGGGGSGGGFGFGDALTDIGSSIWDALPSFDTGGFTGSGKGAGMDGKGGFPAMLHPNELVLNKNQQRGLSGGGSQFTQNVNIIATNQNEIDRRIQMQAPMIARLASDLVQGQMGRGGSMSREIGRRL